MANTVYFLDDLSVSSTSIETLFHDRLASYIFRIGSLSELKNMDSAELAEIVGLVTVTSPVTAEIVALLPNLRAVSVSFTGYNHIDLAGCKARDVQVYNVPAYSTSSVAELTLALALNLLREIPESNQAVKAGSWNQHFIGHELRGKSVGIIGTGEIGCEVARLFHAFGCRVLGYSRSQRETFLAYGEYRSLEQLLSEADIVTVHCPMNAQTANLLNKDNLRLCQPNSLLLNVARGPIVDADALLERIEATNMRAALDVFAIEPLPADSPLRNHPRVLVTPHIAYRTREALDRKAAITFDNLADCFAGRESNARLV